MSSTTILLPGIGQNLIPASSKFTSSVSKQGSPCTLYFPAVPLDSIPETGSFDIGLNQLDDAGCVEVAVAIGIVDRKRDCGTPQGTVESQSL